MDFPEYVPEVVRVDIHSRIYGDDKNRHGWSASLASAETSLRNADAILATALAQGDQCSINQLRIEKAEAQKHRDGMASEVACLNRLAHDARMKPAYVALSKDFTTDDQWRNFTYAAWAARVDYSKFRDRKKQTEVLANEIANAAENLATMLGKFHSTGICGPGELSSIPALLEGTDNHDMDNRNLHMWRSMRKHVLGRDGDWNDSDDVDGALNNHSPADNSVKVTVEFVALEAEAIVDTAAEARNMLRYAWGTAPGLDALLETVARAAREFTANESGMIGAAIKKRQSNPSTEYIRAFAHLLFDEYRFQNSTALMNAMAMVATVVINDPQVDVSYDDVRKSILKQ
jgi:hypothetical protein